MFENVLVAIDLSDHAGVVTGLVRDLATKTGSEVRVLHVEEMGFAGRAGQVPLEEHAEAERAVADAVAILEAAGLKATGAVRAAQSSRVAGEIAAEAAASASSVIIVGAHGHGGRYGGLVGSTANRLVHSASVPVLVVP